MNILFISTWDIVGGAALCAWNLGLYLKKQGHNVHFIVGYKKSNEANVYQYPENRILDTLSIFLRKDIVALRTACFANDIDFGIGNEVLQHPWFKNADIVNCQNLHGGYFKLSTLKFITRSKPTVWTLHDEWAIMPHGAWSASTKAHGGFFERDVLSTYPCMFWNNRNYLMNKKRMIYNNISSTIVTGSKWLGKRVNQSVLQHQSIQLIHNGIDAHLFHPVNKQKARKELGLRRDSKIVLLVANAGLRNSQKGWNYIEAIVKQLDTAKDAIEFVCLGGNAKDTELSSDRIRFITYTDDKHCIAKYYSAADVLLFPSVFDNFPLVTLEAQACGLPVVSFDVGGVKEAVLHKKTGYIAKYKNIKDIVSGIQYVLSLPKQEYNAMKKRARENIHKKFTLEIMGKEYERLYKTLLKKKI